MTINFGLNAQQTLTLTRAEAESLFLVNNLELISEKLNIESQKAEIIQAKTWANPELTIGEINLWATKRQTGGETVSPPFWNNFGKNQQIAIELEQLIETAGKRKKRVALEQVGVSKAEQNFEELLRQLKLELRSQLTELQFINNYIKIHQNLIESISKLTQAYQNQLEKGNISKAEYIRLKAQELEINKEILDLSNDAQEIQTRLKILLHLNPSVNLEISDEGFVKNTDEFQLLLDDQILEKAKENRPDYRLAILEEEYANKLLILEKAQKTPDLTLGVSYDRNGGTMLDFIGVGVKFELPVLNRNKAAIQKAEIEIQNAKILKEKVISNIENEVLSAYHSVQKSIEFLRKVSSDYERDLDMLLESYHRNFTIRNVNMLEYFDFIDTYMANKKIILETQKDINLKIEMLNYSLGQDL